MKHVLRTLVLAILVFLFTVIPAIPAQAAEAILLQPNQGKVGTTVLITGSGFDPSVGGLDKLVDIYFSPNQAAVGDNIDQKALTYVIKPRWRVEGTGNFITDFTVPAELNDGPQDQVLKSGTYYFYVTVTDAKTIKAVATFTAVVAAISSNPDNGAIGANITITGTNFAANEKITINYDSQDITDQITSGGGNTNTNGGFTCTIAIPQSLAGAHTITAIVASEQGKATFTVKPTVSLSLASGASGSSINVSGSGFAAQSDVTLDFGTVTGWGKVKTDQSGKFSTSLAVPSVGAGTYDVKATDQSANSAVAQFTTTVSISLSPAISQSSPGYVGLEVEIKGTGFKASSPITITYATDPVVVATTTSDAQGAFSVKFTVPMSLAGAHTIAVSDGTSTQQVAFTMESTAPPIPQPIVPFMGDKAKSKARFEWQPVDDPSKPVTYDLQVATDANFTTKVLDKKGLTISSYTLTDAEKLKSTEEGAPYYYRLRAVDSASNASSWTGTGTFYVSASFFDISGLLNKITSMEGWVPWAILGGGILIIFFFGFWAGRKSKGGGGYGYY